MFGFSRQSSAAATETAESKDELAAEKTVRDRRKISGARVACRCEFSISNPDPFMHSKTFTKGLMVLNVRGCCVYPEDTLSLEDTEKTFPESRLLTIKNMVLTGNDGKVFNIPNLSIRRVRLLTDEHGEGIILRFVNLSEEQLDILINICNRYAEQN